jgi:hypothetical protein
MQNTDDDYKEISNIAIIKLIIQHPNLLEYPSIVARLLEIV